jgi:hypothetical protein
MALVSGTGEYEADLRRIFMLLLTIIIHVAHHFPRTLFTKALFIVMITR